MFAMAIADTERSATTNTRQHKRRPASKRLWIIAAAITITVGLAVLLAPMIVARTSLRHWVAQQLIEPLDATATVGSASLGWFSSPICEDVRLNDREGRLALHLPNLQVGSTLISLASDATNLGEIQAPHAKLHLYLRDDGSSLEDLLAPLFEPRESSGKQLTATIKITDGVIILHDQFDEKTWRFEQVNATVKIDPDAPLDVRVTAIVPTDENVGRLQAGRLAVGLSIDMRDAPPSPKENQLVFKSDALPLEMLQCVLSRFAPETKLFGRLGADLQLGWGGPEKTTSLSGQTTIDELSFAAPWLDGDVLELRQTEVQCDATCVDDWLNVKQLLLMTDVARVSITGACPLDELRSGQWWSVFGQRDYDIGGDVDLAKLAGLFPKLLNLRKDVAITGGKAAFRLRTGQQNGDRLWQGQADLRGLTAVHEKQTIEWNQPIELALLARRASGQVIIDTLHCQSDFLTLDGRGRLDDFVAQANFDLGRLTAELRRLVDLGETRLAGTGTAEIRVQQTEGKQLSAIGGIRVENFQCKLPSQDPWSEPELLVRLRVAGQGGAKGWDVINTAILSAAAGKESISLKLTEPVNEISQQTVWPISLTAEGTIDHWLPRAKAWVPLDDWQISGPFRLTASGTYGPQRITAHNANLDIKRLSITLPTVRLVETGVSLRTAVEWQRDTQQLELSEVVLTAPSLGCKAKRVKIATAGDRMVIDGQMTCEADLARVQSWFDDPKTVLSNRLAGKLVAQIAVQNAGDDWRAKMDCIVRDLAVLTRDRTTNTNRTQQAPRVVWRDDEVRLSIAGEYRGAEDVIQLEALDLEARSVTVGARGTIRAPTSQCIANLSGTVKYDLKNLAPLLQSYTGRQIRLTGKHEEAFSLRGSLGSQSDVAGHPISVRQRLAGARASLDFSWESADIFGLQIGGETIHAELNNSVLSVKPLDIAVGKGRLMLNPRVQLSDDPVRLLHDKGPVIRNVQVTREVCARGLKFVAPVVADAVEVEGRLSVALDHAKLPLPRVAEGDIVGRLTIHEMRLTPGKSTRDLVALAGQIEAIFRGLKAQHRTSQASNAAIMLSEQQIPFRMAKGRVHHRGLEMKAGSAIIRTSGSVGLDETLDLVVEVPIQKAWVGPRLQRLGWHKQVIRIPVRGTLKKPKIEGRVLANLAKQLGQQAAQDLINQQLKRGLDQLFRP
jgi:translocation and assembly module TamB